MSASLLQQYLHLSMQEEQTGAAVNKDKKKYVD